MVSQVVGPAAAAPTAQAVATEEKSRDVRPNRTVPTSGPANPVISIPDSPSDAEVLRARVFAEALVPIGSPTSSAENQALARALQSYLAAPGERGTAEITRFLQAFPGSAWRPALLANLGLLHRRTGYFTKALAAWDEALDAGGGGGRPAWPRDG